jgi:very long chain acyl-CoA dehydrogenase
MFAILDFDLRAFFYVQNLSRCLSTQAKTKTVDDRKTKSSPSQQPHNHSFVHNLFRGQVESSQLFPFPIALDQEQIEYVGAFIDPVSKFFLEVNDAAKNDANAVSLMNKRNEGIFQLSLWFHLQTIDDNTLDALWELGAFGLQVPAEYGGLALNNTQYGRLAEIIGMYDLGLGICVGAHQSIGFKVNLRRKR